ncbi:MAG: hypothetical protein ABW215_24380 [Kibdelosporangium sp.]
MADITRQYPALAKVAARAAGAASPAVRFNVGHFEGVATEFDAAPPTDPHQVAGEMLAAQIGGVGFRLHTWSPMTPGYPAMGVTAEQVETGLFDGSVVINPDFLYDSTHSTEILLTLGHDPWQPDYADSLMITQAYKAMASAAGAGDQVPILFLQSPVAPFKDPPPRFRVDGSGEAPRVSNGLALRMLIGLDSGNPRKRLALVRNIAWVAAEFGMGLQVTDRRFGRVRGEWWSVLRHEPDIYQRKKEQLFGWAPPGVPAAAQLLTFVGPARIGSSAAIASDLLARNVGILAVSEASLQEIAFINIVTPVAPVRSVAEPSTGRCQPIAAGLGALGRECGLTVRSDAGQPNPIGDSPACDYQMLRTGPVAPRIAGRPGQVYRPVWAAWEIPLVRDERGRSIDVPKLVLAGLGVDGRVDYCRARVSPAGKVRGRAKISVALDPAVRQVDVPDLLSDLCAQAQREVLTHLVRHGIALRAIHLQVAWRERWVSR